MLVMRGFVQGKVVKDDKMTIGEYEHTTTVCRRIKARNAAISEKRKKGYAKTFKELDEDNSGTLDAEEVRTGLMKHLHVMNLEGAKQWIKDAADDKNAEVLTLKQFVEMMEMHAPVENDVSVKDIAIEDTKVWHENGAAASDASRWQFPASRDLGVDEHGNHQVSRFLLSAAHIFQKFEAGTYWCAQPAEPFSVVFSSHSNSKQVRGVPHRVAPTRDVGARLFPQARDQNGLRHRVCSAIACHCAEVRAVAARLRRQGER